MSRKREIDVDQLRDLIEVQHLQHRIVSEMTGIPAKKMTKFCRRYGITTQRTGPRGGEGHPEWKGGRFRLGRYMYIYAPDHPNATKQRRVAEHRLVMEKKLGRFLLCSEVVHHLDGNPQNNNIENLVLFSRNSDHLAEELKGKVPNWTPEGRQAMAEMTERKRKYQGDKRERQRQADRQFYINRRRKESGGDPQPLPTGHPTS
jgi:hypothetical protein